MLRALINKVDNMQEQVGNANPKVSRNASDKKYFEKNEESLSWSFLLQ